MNIISASRRTDIPAFHFKWFLNSLNSGKFGKPDFIVFWTKNPLPALEHLNELPCQYYFQYSLNKYPKWIEPNISPVADRINIFKKLSEAIGKEKVIWRYDPILFTKEIGIEKHVKKFKYLAKRLHNHTDTVIISFIDIYDKIEKLMEEKGIRTLTKSEQLILGEQLVSICKVYGLKIKACSEIVDIVGIKKSDCIDYLLISKITGKYIEYSKDLTQRGLCGCVKSNDIGVYNTCKHGCIYCYASNNEKERIPSFI